MAEYIFIANDELVRAPNDEFIAEGLPSLPCGGISRDARAQLYSLVTGTFLEDALQMELLIIASDGKSPFVYELDELVVDSFTRKEEDDLDALVAQWRFTQDIEKLNVENNDISEFAFTLAHLCRTSRSETDLGVFLLSDA